MEIDDNIPEVESNTETKTKSEADLREHLLNHLAGLNNIHFKSQQIGEPELNFSEKRKIAEEVLNRSHSTFLSRFGYHLLPEHLPYFENVPDNDTYEVQFYVNKLRRCQCKPASKVQIKNRRFEAMKRLMAEGEYFSVSEMRKRNPLLFDQLLGNFLKNPVMKIDSEEHAVAYILLEQIEQDQVAALKQSQIEAEMKEAQEYTSSDEDYNEECNDRLHEQTDVSNLEDNSVLWGKEYKNNHVIGQTRWKNKQASSKRKIVVGKNDLTQEEKMLLINEFTSSMFNSFLQGKDEYNYGDIDNNPDYDDVNQCNVDEEEKYFDSESPQEASDTNTGNDDDEFDKFMKEVENQVASEKLVESLRNMNSNDK